MAIKTVTLTSILTLLLTLPLFADARNLTNSPQTWYDGGPDLYYRSSFNHVNATMGVRFTF